MEMHKTKTFRVALKSCLFLALSTLAFSSFAYLGNPTRPDTVWVPVHCEGGCMKGGYYLKVLNPPVPCGDISYVDGYPRLHNYVVVNPGMDSDYPGWGM